MIKNYLKMAWRNMLSHKAYAVINIAGLSIGLTACLIVATVVVDELSYDKQWKNGDNLYRVLATRNVVKGEQPQSVVLTAMGPSLKKDFPEVIEYCRMSTENDLFSIDTTKQPVTIDYLRAERSAWNMLDLKIIKGDPKKKIEGYGNLVITRKLANRYFGSTDPVSKIIYSKPQFGSPAPYIITGIIDDIPYNTHLRSDALVISERKEAQNIMPARQGGSGFSMVYVMLKPGLNIQDFTKRVNATYKRQTDLLVSDFNHEFQNIKDIYLTPDSTDHGLHGSKRMVYIFAGVAALLLVIACINFINLTVSRIFNRAKETGIRKVLGAGRGQLISRFLTESLLFFLIAFVFALMVYPLALKPVEVYMEHQLVVTLGNVWFLLATVSCIIIISLITGLYPAWYLSKPQPATIMRKNVSEGIHLNLIKKSLVVGQFVISAAIIIITLVVQQQLTFISKKDLGFSDKNLLSTDFTNWGTKGAEFKHQVKSLSGVENASIAGWSPTRVKATITSTIILPGEKEKVDVDYITGDVDLLPTLKFRMKNGRQLNAKMASDVLDDDSLFSNFEKTETQSTIATAYTAKLFRLKLNSRFSGEGVPVGIIEDFNNESLHVGLKPTFIRADSNRKGGYMLIRVKPGSEQSVLTSLHSLNRQFYPDNVLNFNWVDEAIAKQYKAESRMQQLFTFFSLLIVFLACLGLFGLVSFSATQRLKEIGIRKVLGASVNSILMLISSEYILLVSISIVIASPIAWYFMHNWLQGFVYRVKMEWWMFAATGFITLLIAFLTVSVQSLKAATANPVKSLRSE